MSSSMIRVAFQELPVDIEYGWVGDDDPRLPIVVFLHEGLGSLTMWQAFPQRLCEAAQVRGLVYSRPGYGRSTPRGKDERWGLDFMHVQANEVLPALLVALGLDTLAKPVWLFGHSDGGSISLIHAASCPARVAGAIVMAPHILVEEFGLRSIRNARAAYLDTELRAKLSRYHDDVDSAFWGWNNIWLDVRFPTWTIESLIPSIRCPLLAIQGLDDVYGTMEQIDGIARRAPQTMCLKLDRCGHAPHRDRAATVIESASQFIRQHSLGDQP